MEHCNGIQYLVFPEPPTSLTKIYPILLFFFNGMASFGVDMIGCDSQCSEHRIEMRQQGSKVKILFSGSLLPYQPR